MITFNEVETKSSILCTEEGDTIILKNSYYFGFSGITSFVDDVTAESVEVYFEKYFRYTLDGLHWSEWFVLSNNSLISIVPKKNHLFSIEYRYIRKGSNSSLKLSLHSITLNFTYIGLEEPNSYKNFCFKRYFPFLNVNSISWAQNVLSKVFKKGIVPRYIERGENLGWDDEDYINFWWTVIYLTALRLEYNNIFNLLQHKDLLKKYLQQKDLYLGRDESLDEYYYLLTHYYDEIMKRGSSCVLDKERQLPLNYENSIIRGELLRVCGQTEAIESVFGIVTSYETGWIVGDTSPVYNYNDFYQDFIRGFEKSVEIENVNLYPLLNADYITEVEVVEGSQNLNVFKINTGLTGLDAGVDSSFINSILVDSDSDYEVSFKVKGLVVGNRLSFAVVAYNSLGGEVGLVNIDDAVTNNNFLVSTTLEGDLFVRGNIFFKDRISFSPKVDLPNQKSLKFSEGVERISPKILFSGNNDIYLYDIKVRVLPVIDLASYITTSGELSIKIQEDSTYRTKEEIVRIISEKLIPLSMNVSEEERVGVSEVDEYIPYTLPFILRIP